MGTEVSLDGRQNWSIVTNVHCTAAVWINILYYQGLTLSSSCGWSTMESCGEMSWSTRTVSTDTGYAVKSEMVSMWPDKTPGHSYINILNINTPAVWSIVSILSPSKWRSTTSQSWSNRSWCASGQSSTKQLFFNWLYLAYIEKLTFFQEVKRGLFLHVHSLWFS